MKVSTHQTIPSFTSFLPSVFVFFSTSTPHFVNSATKIAVSSLVAWKNSAAATGGCVHLKWLTDKQTTYNKQFNCEAPPRDTKNKQRREFISESGFVKQHFMEYMPRSLTNANINNKCQNRSKHISIIPMAKPR